MGDRSAGSISRPFDVRTRRRGCPGTAELGTSNFAGLRTLLDFELGLWTLDFGSLEVGSWELGVGSWELRTSGEPRRSPFRAGTGGVANRVARWVAASGPMPFASGQAVVSTLAGHYSQGVGRGCRAPATDSALRGLRVRLRSRCAW